MPQLIWVDYCILGIIGFSGLIGLIRGLIREVFSLAAWCVAVWIGLRFSRDLAAHLEPAVSLTSARIAISFAILFFACLLSAGLLIFLVNKLVQSAGLTGTDRLAGMAFGIARGVLLVAVVVLLAAGTPLPEDVWWKESKLIPPFQSLALRLRDQFPAKFAGRIKFSNVFHR